MAPRDRTRWSLFYVATYLTTAGLGLTFMPRLTLDMLWSNGTYELPFVRMSGLFCLGLAGFVIATIRYRLIVLYPTIIAVRVVFCTGYVVLYRQTGDPFFLTTLGIVGTGLVLSTIGFLADARSDRPPTDAPRVYRPEPGPVRMLEANGLRFAALEWRPAATDRAPAPIALLVHGFPDTAHTWDRIGPALAATGYHVVAPFLRGYAPSGIPARDADARTLGEDVVGIVDALGVDQVVLVGHDWGAESAYAAVAIAPHRFSRLVTIAIPHRAALRFTPRLLWGGRHFLTLPLPGAEARFAANDYAGVEVLFRRWSPTWRYTTEDVEAAKNVLAAPGGLHAALGYYRAAQLRTPAFMRAPVEVPTLTIAGADDPGVPPSAFEQVRPQFRAGYQVATIPGGHFCHRESPDACIAAIRAFLDQTTTSK
jgi:pimeloyl-ACP methyl ester carboxylesterase